MHSDFFDLVARKSRLSKKNVAIAKRILVEKIPRRKLVVEEGMTRQMIHKIIKSFEKDAENILESHKLTIIEVVVNDQQKASIESDENDLINQILKAEK